MLRAEYATVGTTTATAEIVEIGGGPGIVLPTKLVDSLGVKVGDELVLTETPDRFPLGREDAETRRQLELGRKVMRENADVLRDLSKR